MSCLASAHFADVRKGALKAISRGLRPGPQGKGNTLNIVRDLLGLRTIQEVIAHCAHYGLEVRQEGPDDDQAWLFVPVKDSTWKGSSFSHEKGKHTETNNA